MKMNEFNAPRVFLEINAADVIRELNESQTNKADMIHLLVKALYAILKQHDALMQSAIGITPELVRIFSDFFQQREEVNLRTIRPQKLRSFISNSEIRAQVTEQSFADMQRLINMVFPIRPGDFQALSANQALMAQMVVQMMNTLVIEESSASKSSSIPKFINAEFTK